MTSSSSSSARRRWLALAAAALAAAGCARGRAGPAPASAWSPGLARARIALLPANNLTGQAVSIQAIQEALELAFRSRQLDVTAGDAVRRAMAVHRIRNTRGVDAVSAKALREELGVDAVLVTSVLQLDVVFPAKLVVELRLVSTGDPPRLLWADGMALGGMDSPGFLGLGVLPAMTDVQFEVVNALAGSLTAYLDRGSLPEARCSPIRPRVAAGVRRVDVPPPWGVALLPFVNQSGRRDASDAVSAELIRQLVATGLFRVVEPGMVRAEMLSRRIIIGGGASLDTANAMGSLLEVPILITGTIRDYSDVPGSGGPPRIEFSVYAIAGATGRVLWWSGSRAGGEDGVLFFGLGRVTTAAALACGASRGIAERMLANAENPSTDRNRENATSAQPPGEGASDAPNSR
jgi:TolB-like protein